MTQILYGFLPMAIMLAMCLAMRPSSSGKNVASDKWGLSPFIYDNLPAPEVIAAEIVEDLEAALEQFREILADIGPVEGRPE